MLKRGDISELAKSFVKTLPQAFTTLNQEMRVVLEQYCQDWLHKMNVVTREEFDTQTQVLRKTREKLDALEKQLENQRSSPPRT